MTLTPKRQLIETQESLRLVTAFRRIKSDQGRAQVIALAETLADIESPTDDSDSEDTQTGVTRSS